MKFLKANKRMISMVLVFLLAAGLLAACGSSGGDSGSTGASGEEERGVTEGTETADPSGEEVDGGGTFRPDAADAAPAGIKEETVSIRADASGAPKEVTVSASLKELPEGKTIRDEADLQDIRNTSGDEEFRQSGTDILWQNKGEDISYEGTSGRTPDVGVDIRYFLNDREVKPSEIAGKSGPVKIRFDYRNDAVQKTGSGRDEKEKKVPYVFLTMAILDGEHFADVEVENGAVTSLGDMDLVVGYGMPGLKDELGLSSLKEAEDLEIPDHVEIRAEATEFSLDFTTTIVSSGMLKDLDTASIDGGDDMVKAMKEMQDASQGILNGMAGLQTGAGTFGSALKAYTDGAAALNDGVSTLTGGMSTLSGSGKDLAAGAAQVADGLAELNEQLSKIDTAALAGDTDGLADSLAGIQSALEADGQALSEGLASLQASYESLAPSMTQAGQSVQTAVTNLQSLQTALQELAAQGADTAACETYPSNAITALSGITLPDASGLDASGILAAASDMGAQLSALQTLFAGLAGGSGTDGTAAQLETLKAGVAKLAEGAAQVKDGVDKYTAGVSKVSAGAGGLQDGSGKLKSGGSELYAGYGKLTQGIAALQSGYALFDEEGIKELGKLAGDDLQNVLDNLRALQKIDSGNRSFSGCAKGTEPTVRYMIETEEITP